MDRANCRVAQDNKFSPAYPNSKTLKGDIYIYNVYLLELYIYIIFPDPKPAVAQHWTERVSLHEEEEMGHLPQLASLPKEPVVSKSIA